jgi:hypothetical protein
LLVGDDMLKFNGIGERALKEKGEAALKRMPPMRIALKAGVVTVARSRAL